MKKQKSSFKGKVISSSDKQRRTSYGYLNLPKDVKVFSLAENTRSCKIDFLPYVVTSPKHPEQDKKEGIAIAGALWYRFPFKIHRNVGTANATVVCPTTFGKKCPICEHLIKRIKEGADKEERSALRAKSRSLYPIIPLGLDKFEEVVHVWDMADALFQDTLIDELKENEDNEDFFTLDNGKTANVRFKWESLGGHAYPEAKSINFTEREAYEESILESVPALDELLKETSYTEIFNKFFDLEDEEDGGTLEEEPEEEEEEEAPAPRTRKHTKPEPEPEEEEEEEPEEEEEEEEPEPAKTVTRTRKPAPKPEPEPEEEEEEEEEEEPEPPKTVKKGTAPATGKSVKSKDKCPYGHRFGIDTDKFKDCDTCEIWDDCSDEKEKKK